MMATLAFNELIKQSRNYLKDTKFCKHIFFCNIYFYEFDEKLQKFVLQKGLTSFVVSKIIIAKISKVYNFGHILKIPCKKFAFDKLYTERKF